MRMAISTFLSAPGRAACGGGFYGMGADGATAAPSASRSRFAIAT
jgi:hypothetical protein